MEKRRKISDNMQTVLDKAIVEPEFRWNLANNKSGIIQAFHISEKEDLEALDELTDSLVKFTEFILVDEFGVKSKKIDAASLTFRKRNPNLTYQEALKH
jgi:ribonuclease HII